MTSVAEPAWLRDVRLRAKRRGLWLRETWGRHHDAGEASMAISHSEVDRTLSEPDDLRRAERKFYEDDGGARRLTSAIEGVDRAADARWSNLVTTLGLTRPEADLLAVALAAEAVPALRRVYGYLHDDVTAVDPTPALAATLFGWPTGTTIGPRAALISWGLARPLDIGRAAFSATTPWEAEPAVLAYVLGEDRPGALGLHGGPVAVDDLPVLFPEVVEEIVAFAADMLRVGGPPVEIDLVAPAGAGRRVLLGQAVAALGWPLTVVDVADLGPAEGWAPAAVREVRHARLSGSLVCWAGAVGPSADAVAAASRSERLTLWTSTSRRPPRGDVVRRSFELPALDRAGRLRLWASVGAGDPPLPVASWPMLAGEVVAAARAVPAGEAAVVDVCRSMLLQTPDDLLVPLPLPYTWDDLVLPDNVAGHLKELEAHARSRVEVLDDWGFARLCPMGRGVTALFAGPSGTGKTMSAQVLARSLGLGLYRVDLAGVVNKYIGETEKHLRTLFDHCERAPAVLFFDEADALFGQRTQVKDAHDRFANIEIDYLLQRMEQFDGIAILASNRKGDLDHAFVRRLRFMVDFVPPTAAERERLWRLALEGHTAADGRRLVGDIDWISLAHGLQLTGADIKSAALAAAFLARSEGSLISTAHVLAGARRELAKQGIVVRPGHLAEVGNGR